MSHYRELTVWQKAMDLVVYVYQFTKKFPADEQYGLKSQMRRAAVSIPSNIAEGSRRKGKDISHFLMISFGSASELETQLEICKKLEYGQKGEREKCEALLSEVLRMLNRMTASHY
ncbi:four helix bundle protein [Candidatus Kaiserbacteria bacterium]|nr:four helix bundle protein [Candidatus Kaiserbacteria bacterium]